MVRVAFVLEGNYTLDGQNSFRPTGKSGVTLVKKIGVHVKTLQFDNLEKLVQALK